MKQQSFPDKTRASATGLVLAGFGLSAFLFSTISHTLFPSSTADFLLLLACGCGVTMLVGMVLVKPVPHIHLVDSRGRETDGYGSRESGWERIAGQGYESVPDSEDEDDADDPEINIIPPTPADGNPPVQLRETSPRPSARSASPSGSELNLKPSISRSSGKTLLGSPINLSGWQLVRNLDFWLLTAIVSLLSGTGLMCSSRSAFRRVSPR